MDPERLLNDGRAGITRMLRDARRAGDWDRVDAVLRLLEQGELTDERQLHWHTHAAAAAERERVMPEFDRAYDRLREVAGGSPTGAFDAWFEVDPFESEQGAFVAPMSEREPNWALFLLDGAFWHWLPCGSRLEEVFRVTLLRYMEHRAMQRRLDAEDDAA